MARPTKYATPICIGLTVLAALGIVIGLITSNAVVAIVALLPAAGYEAYRTEGASTRWASWALAAVLVVQLAFVVFNVDLDLVALLGESERTVAGYQVALGDARVAASGLVVVLSLILITRTRGIYTRWLAAICLVASLGIAYILAPDAFADLLRTVVDEVPQ